MSTWPNSTELIAAAENRCKELDHKEFDWRSFYNGFLEGFAWTAPRFDARNKELVHCLQEAMQYIECTDGTQGDAVGSAADYEEYRRWVRAVNESAAQSVEVSVQADNRPLPCPFCGAVPEPGEHVWIIHHAETCFLTCPDADSIGKNEGAIRAWNTRISSTLNHQDGGYSK